MIEIGRICIKLAGRDAGREAAIVEILDENYALVDGNVRRKRCNIYHLEPTSKKIDIKKGASHEEVKKEFLKLNIAVWETKPRQTGERPRKQRNKKESPVEQKPKKKAKAKKEKKAVKTEIIEEKPKSQKLKVSEESETKSQSKEKKPLDVRIISVTKKKETAKKAKPAEKK